METTVPDGGWGWVLVASCFFFHLVGGGHILSLSVLYVSWVEDFQTGRGVTAWVLTLSITFMVMTGPVAASLGARFGYRIVVLIGSFIMSFGMFLSFFATSVYFLMVTVGVIAGIGLGLCYLPVIAILPTYFDKKRAIAVGIGTSGVGVGTFILPPFLTWLESLYSWRGVLLIVSGLMLNMCVFGALMRPVEHVQKQEISVVIEADAADNEDDDAKHDNVEEEKVPFVTENGRCVFPYEGNDPSVNTVADGNIVTKDIGEINLQIEDHAQNMHTELTEKDRENGGIHLSNGNLPSSTINDSSMENGRTGRVTPHSNSDFKYDSHSAYTPDIHSLMNTPVVSQRNRHLLPQNKRLISEIGGSFQHIVSSNHTIDNIPKPKFSSVHELRRRASKMSIKSHENDNDLSPNNHNIISASRKDVMLSGSFYNVVLLDKHLNSSLSLLSKTSGTAIIHDPALRNACITSVEVIPTDQAETNDLNHSEETSRPGVFSRHGVYCNLMRSSAFLLMAISNFLINLSYLMPVMYLVDRAVDNGIDKSAASLALSLYGAGNLCGRILMGWIADRSKIDGLITYIVSILVCGAATCLSSLCGPHLFLHAAYGLIFGLFIGAYVLLTPIVLVDLLGVDVVGEAYGLVLAFEGVATLVGTPLAGWLFDWTNNYTSSFIIHGLFLVAAALLLLPLQIITRRKQSKLDQ